MSKLLTYCVKSVNFDNSYKNVPLFKSAQERNDALLGNCEFSPIFNFNFGNGLYTRAVVNNFDENGNYFILKIEENGVIDYRFYFITNYNYNTANQFMLSLECDVISTYFVALTRNDFSEDMIQRAHCNRFNPTPVQARYHFDVTDSSEIIKIESEIEKKNINRNKLRIHYSNIEYVNNWMNDNILCWVYIYVDRNHEFNFLKSRGYPMNLDELIDYEHKVDRNRINIENTEITNDYSVLCVPILKNEKKLFFADYTYGYILTLDNEGLEAFMTNASPFVYNIKLSMMPPCSFDEVDYVVASNSNLAISQRCVYESIAEGKIEAYAFAIDGQVIRCCGAEIDESYKYGIFSGVQDRTNALFFDDFFANFNFAFSKENLKSFRSIIFEPKVLSHCYSVVLRDSSGSEYRYNPLLYNSNIYRILYDEPNSVANSNYYIRPAAAGLYSNADEYNWNGVTNAVDNSIPIANDTLKEYIANNKNFLLTKTVPTVTNFAANMLAGNVIGAVGGVANDIFMNLTDLDNIDNRKRNLSNTSNSGALTLQVNKGINYYIDIEQSYMIDQVRFYNYIYKFGYRLEKIGNVYDYLFNRHYFNFIQAEVEEINRTIPQFAKNKIQEILRNGVRFWHDYTQMFNYDMENYEVFLD